MGVGHPASNRGGPVTSAMPTGNAGKAVPVCGRPAATPKVSRQARPMPSMKKEALDDTNICTESKAER